MSGLAGRGAVLCAGRLYCDLIFTGLPRLPSLGTETFAGGLGLHAGGGAFIAAAWFAALGRESGLVAHLPAAPFAAPVSAEIAARGIDARHCAPAPAGADPQVTVAMVADGDRAFLTRAPEAAMPRLSAGDLRGAGWKHLHVGELGTLAENPWLIEAARGAGMSISLDCGWTDVLPGGAAELIGAVDVFLPNEDEAARLDTLGLGRAAPVTVVKRGAAGAELRSKAGDHVAPGQDVRAVDSTGAGDAFCAGFVDKWLKGAAPEACLRAGNRCGALAVSAVGGAEGVAALAG